MEIKQLEYVIMAADMGSFNKASEFLYTTQSNVSKVIRSLEKELGYEIFRRQGNGVALTDAGKVLYEQSQQILMMLKKFETFSDLAGKTCFHIAAVMSNFLARHFAAFIQEHDEEKLCLKMWEGNISEVVNLVEQGEVELGFLYLSGKQRDSFQTLLQKKGLYYKEILTARVEICIGKNHPFYGRESLTPEEIRSLKYVRVREDNLSKAYHLNYLEKILGLEKNMNHAVEVGSDYALINILSMTDRAHLCYGGAWEQIETIPGDLQSIPVAVEDEAVALGYVHRIAEPVSHYGEEFLRQIEHSAITGRNTFL